MVLKTISDYFRSRFAKKVATEEALWHGVAAVKSYGTHSWGVGFRCENGNILIRWLAPDLVNIRFRPRIAEFDLPPKYPNYKVEWPQPPFKVTEDYEYVEINSASLVCRVRKSNFSLSFETPDERLIATDAGGLELHPKGTVRLSMQLQPDETCHGLGACGADINLRGKHLIRRNIEYESNPYHPDGVEYYSIPFYLGVHVLGVYGVLWEDIQAGFVDVGATKADELICQTESDELSYFLFVGSDVKSILNRYTELTGRIELPPLGLFGQRHITSQTSTQNDAPVGHRSVEVTEYECAEARHGTHLTTGQPEWDLLRAYLGTVLNMGLAGRVVGAPKLIHIHQNVSAEFYTRWLQAISLMPMSYTDVDEMLLPGIDLLQQPHALISQQTNSLRHRFAPYLYSVVALCREYGWPMVQPLFVLESKNPELREISDCYLVGNAILAAPVIVAKSARREVYLPVGQWYDYWTDRLYEGRRAVSISAPLERLPLFIRAGSVLPMWSGKNENEIPTLTYRVYPGFAETVLYEDLGEGFEYRQGEYRWVYISCEWDGARLEIKRRIAGSFLPEYHRIRLEIVGLSTEPNHVRIDRQGAPVWFFDEAILEMTVDDKFQHVEVRMDHGTR